MITSTFYSAGIEGTGIILTPENEFEEGFLGTFEGDTHFSFDMLTPYDKFYSLFISKYVQE